MSGEKIRNFWKRQLDNKFNCYYCEREVFRDAPEVAYNRATIDHIIPRCLGGTNHSDNLVISCRGCNIKKSIKENNDCKKLKELGIRFYV